MSNQILQVFEQERPEGRHHHAHIIGKQGAVIWACKPEHFHPDYGSALQCAERGMAAIEHKSD